MSAIAIQSSGSGAGTLSIAAPITATNRTLTLPDATTTFVGTDATQTLTNKTIQGGAITSGTAVASTSGTAIDFTSIPSWVKRVTVMFNGVSTSGTSNIQIQLGDSGGIETTGYSASAMYPNGPTAAYSATGLIQKATMGLSTDTLNGMCIITNISGNIWTSMGSNIESSASPRYQASAGIKTLSNTLTQIRITTVNGTDTFDAGSINILYEG
jgi:hypothetical protein